MKKVLTILALLIIVIGCEKQVCYRCITFCNTDNSIGSITTIICEKGMTEQEAIQVFKDQLGEKDCSTIKCFEE